LQRSAHAKARCRRAAGPPAPCTRTFCQWLLQRGSPHVRHLDVSVDAPPWDGNQQQRLGLTALLTSALAACTGLTRLVLSTDLPSPRSANSSATALPPTWAAASLTAVPALEYVWLEGGTPVARWLAQLPPSLTELHLVQTSATRQLITGQTPLPPEVSQHVAAWRERQGQAWDAGTEQLWQRQHSWALRGRPALSCGQQPTHPSVCRCTTQ
jgi:hypothetical protein